MKDNTEDKDKKAKKAWLDRLQPRTITKNTTDEEFFEIIVPEEDKIPEEITILEKGMKGFYDPNYIRFFFSGTKDGKRVCIQSWAEKEWFEEDNNVKVITCREFLVFNKEGKYRRFYLPETNVE